jgi:glycosyltransferase involved in cell wall biosynthesis
MAAKRTKLAYLVSHPIQYQAPLLRYLTEHTDLDLEVFFMSDFSLRAYEDKEFKTQVEWDVPLVEGYKHRFLKGIGPDSDVELLWPISESLGRILKREGFDALWSHGYHHQNSIRAIVSAHRAGIVTMTRSDIFEGSVQGKGLKRRVKDALVQRLFRHIDLFLAVGKRNKDYYLKQGVPESKIFTLIYAVDNQWFRDRCEAAAPKAEEIRSSLGIEPDQQVVLYASKLIKRKNVLDLAHAYEKMVRNWPGSQKPALVIVGDGELRPELEKWMGEAALDSVHFVGFKNQSELPAYFKLADLFVLPANAEPWGLIVNEVMNASLPVIVTDEVGCSDDLVLKGKTGAIVKAGDVDELSSTMFQLLQDRPGLEQMGTKASDHIQNCGFEQNAMALKEALASRGLSMTLSPEPIKGTVRKAG